MSARAAGVAFTFALALWLMPTRARAQSLILVHLVAEAGVRGGLMVYGGEAELVSPGYPLRLAPGVLEDGRGGLLSLSLLLGGSEARAGRAAPYGGVGVGVGGDGDLLEGLLLARAGLEVPLTGSVCSVRLEARGIVLGGRPELLFVIGARVF